MPFAKPATVRTSAVTMRDMAVTRVTCPSPFGLVTFRHDVTVEAEAEAEVLPQIHPKGSNGDKPLVQDSPNIVKRKKRA